MSRLPQLERLLVDEARRQDRRASAARRRTGRRSRRRTVLIVVLVLLAFASVAVAASRLLPEGRPVPVPPQVGSYVHRYEGPSRVLGVRASDPGGGPRWGIRVTRSRRTGGMGCVQVGRVQDGRVGIIGRDGAFGNDGRFHALPKQAIQACGGLDAHGRLSLRAHGMTAMASAVSGRGRAPVEGCETAEERRVRTVEAPRRIEAQVRLARARHDAPGARAARRDLARARREAAARTPACSPAAARTLAFGFAGPGARSVTLREDGRPATTLRTPSRDGGAYLFVLSGPAAAHRAVHLTARYAGGLVCALGGRMPRALHGRCARAAGYVWGRAKHGNAGRSRRTPTQRALARMAAARARAARRPLDVPIRGLSLLRFRFVPPLRGLHAYQVMIRCSRRGSTGHVTKRLRGGRATTVMLPGPLTDCRLPAKAELTQSGTGRKIGTFVLPRP